MLSLNPYILVKSPHCVNIGKNKFSVDKSLKEEEGKKGALKEDKEEEEEDKEEEKEEKIERTQLFHACPGGVQGT